MEQHLPASTLKKITVLAITLLTVGTLFFYMLWATRIARQTVLMPWIPEWSTYVAVSVLVGLVFAGRALYQRPTEKALKRVSDAFPSGFCAGFVLSINSCNVGVYLLPGDTVHYESAYETTFPGPAIGKSNRCEAGLWIKDLTTERRIQLCTTKSDLHNQITPGMKAVWVTAHSNKIGSYISDYKFIYTQPASHHTDL